MSGWRAALRIARREARRSAGRSALVIALIAVPVAALSFAAIVQDSTTPTPTEDANLRMGAAEALVSWPYRGPVIQQPTRDFAIPTTNTEGEEPSETRLRALLPGSNLVPVDRGGVNIRTTAGVGRAGVRMLDLANPLTQGMITLLEGRAPASAGEVALSRKALDRTGTQVDGTLTTEDGRTFRVVGAIEEPDRLDNTTVVALPGTFDATDRAWLATTPLSWSKVKDLNRSGIAVLSREVLNNLPPRSELYPELPDSNELTADILILVAGLAVLEMSLLAGSALAVGARRRKRDLALIAAVGGSPSHVRRVVLADGVVMGTAAALGGVLLGVLASVAARPLVEWLLAERFAAQRFFPSALAALALLAIITGVLAALVPAWISSRQDVVTALAGRRGITRSRRRWLLLGLILIATGVAAGVLSAINMLLPGILVALILTEVGLVLCTPSLLGLLARAGRWLPVPLRIALRDASRNRTAAAPAISAVMAAVIGSVAVSVMLTSQSQQEASQVAGGMGDVTVYRLDDLTKSTTNPIPASVTTALRNTMPTAETHELKLLSCDGGPCFAHLRPPPARECPYTLDVLHRDPTESEQQQALADPRCTGVNRTHRYFGIYTTPNGFLVVAPPASVQSLLNLTPSEAATAAAALQAGKIVVNDPSLVENDKTLLATGTNATTTEAPAYATPSSGGAPLAVMTEQTARALGYNVSTFTMYATTTRMPTDSEQEALTAALGGEYEVTVTRPTESDVQQALTILGLVAGVITLAAAALATGLAAADGRRDLTTLAAVGATPTLRKLLSLSQAGVIAGLGGLLGTTAGTASALALLAALNQGYRNIWPQPDLNPLTIPWPTIGISLLLVPAVAMLGAALFTRSRLPIERRE
ncbi:FtsX-like permease family protein [Lentzea sp. NPDC058450]|uniref:FtsX-like permease family protein n=1 Tax=Lentzea sp. NPDC058450 TaxID=3346505 RepID=UPI00365E18DC